MVMSVINRMLRDLDQRQQQTKNQTYTPAAVAPQPIHWLWIVAIVVISAAVIVGALNLWWMYSADKATPNEGEQIVGVQPVPNQQTSIATLPKSEPKPESKPAAEKPKQAQTIVDVRALEQIQEQSAEAEPVKQEPAKQEPVAIAQPKPKPEPAEKESSFAVTRVQLSPTELAEVNLAKAREALEKGEQARGQELLEKALMVKPDHVIVRSELAAYWYGRGMTTRALTLLQQGLDMKPQQSEWQLLYARMLERIGRVEQAYTALITIDLNATEVQELLKLRAAAATQLGYFNEAAADYTALAAEYGEQRWWLAAAVAYEDGDNIDAAVRCYRQALQYPELGNDARAYIDQRLAVLEGY
ncbi:tetratricopeptide repeat protein [Pseudidiomarina gelatinasegens]|uniref:Tetratricopeptide repeat protein n=2 Tax=Pseudidiomarina gelatinasegens TaxID=2487740 RepID=A0A451GE30_9GAMM|nr:tetratricopeptide repeat protein [Pseudidiomarina gelatinasegens]